MTANGDIDAATLAAKARKWALVLGDEYPLLRRELRDLADIVESQHGAMTEIVVYYDDCRDEARALRNEGNLGTAVLLDNIADAMQRAALSVPADSEETT